MPLTDSEILDEYWRREDTAVTHTREKYHGLCASICRDFLDDARDIEECLGDMYMALWNSIPPNRPESLKNYLCRIARNLSINRAKYNTSEKRDERRTVSFEEARSEVEEQFQNQKLSVENAALTDAINTYLSTIPKKRRIVLILRYWHGLSLAEIANKMAMNLNTVKSMVSRELRSMKAYLYKEGICDDR